MRILAPPRLRAGCGGHADAPDLPFQRHAGRREHAAAHFLAQAFDVGGRRVAGVDQEIAVLLRHLRAAAGQAAAAGGVDQFPRLHVRRIAERGAAGAGADRLRGFAAGADLRHARGDRRRRAGLCAQPRARDDRAVRQRANGDRRRPDRRRTAAALLAGARDDLRPVEARRRFRRRRRRRSSPPRRRWCRECRTGIPARPARPRRHVPRPSRPAPRRRRSTPSGFDRDRGEAARQPDHHARHAAVAHDQVGAAPITCTGTSGGSARRNAQGRRRRPAGPAPRPGRRRGTR